MAEATASHPDRPRRRRSLVLLSLGAAAVAAYLLVAYVLLPVLWRRRKARHPALTDAHRITHTAHGIPGNPLNIALVGTEADIHLAMLAAQRYTADPITRRSAMRIAAGVVFDRPYDGRSGEQPVLVGPHGRPGL